MIKYLGFHDVTFSGFFNVPRSNCLKIMILATVIRSIGHFKIFCARATTPWSRGAESRALIVPTSHFDSLARGYGTSIPTGSCITEVMYVKYI